MVEFGHVAFRPLAPAEAASLASLGRMDASFEGLLNAAVRAQFLHAALGSSLGEAAEHGLRAAEACAAFRLAARPAGDEGELDAKDLVLRAFSAERNGTMGAMIRAALDADRRRLRLAAGCGSAPRGADDEPGAPGP